SVFWLASATRLLKSPAAVIAAPPAPVAASFSALTAARPEAMARVADSPAGLRSRGTAVGIGACISGAAPDFLAGILVTMICLLGGQLISITSTNATNAGLSSP